MPKVGIRTRFTLLLSVIFVLALIAAWVIFSQALRGHAQDEISYRGQILVAMLNSVRDYTSQHVNPLLADDLQTEPQFIPESVPAFSAHETFENLRTRPEYSQFQYKEAATNPTNPRDRANDMELGLIDQFRTDATLTELSGYTERDGVQVFYNSRPLRLTKDTCLACHSTPENAPASLIATYGSDNGFGWELGDVIAAQTIYVPAQEVFDQTQQAMLLVMGILVVIFAVVVLMTNTVLRRAVVRPVIQIAGLAQLIEEDTLQPDAPELETVSDIAKRSDEFGSTAKVLQKMAAQIYAREQKFKAQIQSLQIQIDTEKQQAQVEEITETDYFHHLQARAKQIRGESRSSESSAAGAAQPEQVSEDEKQP